MARNETLGDTNASRTGLQMRADLGSSFYPSTWDSCKVLYQQTTINLGTVRNTDPARFPIPRKSWNPISLLILIRTAKSNLGRNK